LILVRLRLTAKRNGRPQLVPSGSFYCVLLCVLAPLREIWFSTPLSLCVFVPWRGNVDLILVRLRLTAKRNELSKLALSGSFYCLLLCVLAPLRETFFFAESGDLILVRLRLTAKRNELPQRALSGSVYCVLLCVLTSLSETSFIDRFYTSSANRYCHPRLPMTNSSIPQANQTPS
jgi:hypothetical protein